MAPWRLLATVALQLIPDLFRYCITVLLVATVSCLARHRSQQEAREKEMKKGVLMQIIKNTGCQSPTAFSPNTRCFPSDKVPSEKFFNPQSCSRASLCAADSVVPSPDTTQSVGYRQQGLPTFTFFARHFYAVRSTLPEIGAADFSTRSPLGIHLEPPHPPLCVRDAVNVPGPHPFGVARVVRWAGWGTVQ